MKKNKGLLVFLAVVGVSVSGPMVKWSLACGASPVMVAFGRMLISAALLLVPALKSGELVAVLRAPKKQLALTCAAALPENGPARVVVGARPMRAMPVPDPAGLLTDGLTPEKIAAFSEQAAQTVPTGSNSRGSAAYRTHLVKVLTARALGGLLV